MKTLLKTAAINNFSPVRVFFRVTGPIQSIEHAREIFRILGQFGNMVEYKFMRCSETLRYLKYGFIVYEKSESANRAVAEHFIKVPPSTLFEKSIEIKVEKSSNGAVRENQRMKN
ncbi:hypothetical protein RO3G_14671 [Rhizopus delemar RA 99-880]|uniref:RRM domain-containing protein n=1 Tax=Rhizopus delemar (strain RA 99-880 / ATCC MYA-4621 / FGSC 9543 / NRRL 43880) TaxID=246409 RepID=I1CND0_RHIO9|nr:hypothetical protein RO3G_14671 [Rhizopus delemar RA 99-880]|eukprot:EIE89960.1 hypothetical protein RO3G_14671 [Rhizopus delemar RA 99-880]